MENCRVTRAKSVREAIALMSTHPDAALIAGGTDLVVKMKDGVAVPNVLIAIDCMPDLSSVEVRDGMLWIGAAVPFSRIVSSRLVAEHAPLLAAACGAVGSPQIRNRGTIAGNVVTASPAGDGIPALVVLEAQVRIDGPTGPRMIPVEQFVLGPGRTALMPAEIVTGFALPLRRSDHRWAYRKLGQRRAMSISIAGVAVGVWLNGGRIAEARVALGSVAPTVRRAVELEKALIGPIPCDEELKRMAPLARQAASPISDIRGSASYRFDMVEALAYQAMYKALYGGDGEALVRAHDDLAGCCRRSGGHGLSGATTDHPMDVIDAAAEADDPVGICVEVTIHGQLGEYCTGAVIDVALPAGATVSGLCRKLGLGGDDYIIALVNQRREFESKALCDGDRVSLMHPVGGG